jgi:hypothetical protein
VSDDWINETEWENQRSYRPDYPYFQLNEAGLGTGLKKRNQFPLVFFIDSTKER